MYYKYMPNAIGFINGYYASHTFTIKNKITFLSFDYYLSPDKPEEQVVYDLKELSEMNSERPYFLLVHVRETSDVSRVKSICDKLGPDYEVIPLEIFIKMAAENPNFKERYMNDK